MLSLDSNILPFVLGLIVTPINGDRDSHNHNIDSHYRISGTINLIKDNQWNMKN